MNITTQSNPVDYWNILVIEDNEDLVRQMKEFFVKIAVSGRPLRLMAETDWDRAFSALKVHKVDLVILDIYKGEANIGGERIGESVLAQIRSTAFVPVIIHTNLPEGLVELTNEFVRLVPKTEGLGALLKQIKQVFATKIPQIHRAIADHLDHTLRDYMWGFVVKNWLELSQIAGKPEFVRVLLQRLAISFSSDGVDEVAADAFPELPYEAVATEKIHPAEFYVKPPMGTDPALGDVRVRIGQSGNEYVVVLWPTCDMVSTGGRTPKTDKALCAQATLLSDAQEFKDCMADPESKSARNKLIELFKNNRDKSRGTSDRFHFLPGLCDIPDLIVDFQDLEYPSLVEMKTWRSLGTLRSPHGELLSIRFERYRNRIGTPDLDNELLVKRCLIAGVAQATQMDPAVSTEQRKRGDLAAGTTIHSSAVDDSAETDKERLH